MKKRRARQSFLMSRVSVVIVEAFWAEPPSLA